ncbi:M28 family peptidase [Cupriavidus necator]|uniref:M28 family peptidase n=1 Tax=Cupriavidus necator TaxID=106590 RepID=UPI0039C35EA7
MMPKFAEWLGLPRIAVVLLVVFGLAWVAMLVLTQMPGHSHSGPLPTMSTDELGLSARLREHVLNLATAEHNVQKYAELEAAAQYIERTLAAEGYVVSRQEYDALGKKVRNLIVTVPSRTLPGKRIIVVGAHYDSAIGSPGANDNGSGVASILELAKRLKDAGATAQSDIVFALYTNEEEPFFRTKLMGSSVHVRSLKEKRENVIAMFSLETMGYYSDVKGSQKYPSPLKAFYPEQGNFIGFVGNVGSLGLVRKVTRLFRKHAAFPSEGIAGPRVIPGIDWSDHAPFMDQGYPSLMVTDTAPYRYPYYHSEQDTIDKIDFDKLAQVVVGLEAVVRDLANNP